MRCFFNLAPVNWLAIGDHFLANVVLPRTDGCKLLRGKDGYHPTSSPGDKRGRVGGGEMVMVKL